MTIITSVFIVYTGAIFFIAYRAFSQTHNHADFLLANRQLPGWLAALSAGASDMSGWLLLGLPGLAFVAHQEAMWLALGLGVGTYLNWKFIAPGLHKQTKAHADSLTLPSYFANRYPEYARPLRLATAIVILFFYVVYLSAGLVAAAKLFVTIFEIDYLPALLASAVVVISYTMLGGFKAVVHTDALQAALMVGALIAASIMLSGAIDWATFTSVTPASSAGNDLGLISIASALAWGLGYPGQPHILARFMATRDTTHIRLAARIAVSWTFVCLICAIAIGILASAHPTLGDYAGDAEKIFIVATQLIFHPLVAGLIIAAILAAIMSTADSQLIVAASALYYDLGRERTSSQSPQAWLRNIRLATLMIGLLSILFALEPNSSVLRIVAYAWAGFGACFGPAIIISLYSKNVRGRAIFLGMLAGSATVMLLETFPIGDGELYSLIPGFIANLAMVGICAVISRP